MEINSDTGVLNVEKMRQQADKMNPTVVKPNRFAESPNVDRTLDNVLIDEVIVTGKHKLQHEKDFDMTYHYLAQVDNGRLLKAYKVSDFDLKAGQKPISKQEIDRDYSILDSLFETEEAEAQKVFAKEYSQRNRYVDIITYHKSRVKLQTGVNLNVRPESDYINACYVNSPFIKVNPANKYITGDTKIIASQGPLPETTDHFWQMIIENNVTMIVSTCKLQENGRTKCNRFWPGSKGVAMFDISQDAQAPQQITVNLLDHVQESSFLERRELEAVKPDGSKQYIN